MCSQLKETKTLQSRQVRWPLHAHLALCRWTTDSNKGENRDLGLYRDTDALTFCFMTWLLKLAIHIIASLLCSSYWRRVLCVSVHFCRVCISYERKMSDKKCHYKVVCGSNDSKRIRKTIYISPWKKSWKCLLDVTTVNRQLPQKRRGDWYSDGKKSKRVPKIDQSDSSVKCFHFKHIFKFRSILLADISYYRVCVESCIIPAFPTPPHKSFRH